MSKKLIYESSTKLRLGNFSPEDIALTQKTLTCTDKSVQYNLQQLFRRLKIPNLKNRWWVEEEIRKLQPLVKVCLVYQDDIGFWTYTGFKTRLQQLFKIADSDVVNKITYPDPKNLPLANPIVLEDRKYQNDGQRSLINAKHGAIQHATGLGKSSILLRLIGHYNRKSIILAGNSQSIAEQLYKMFVYHFGTKNVGKFYGTKKEHKKLFTIALPGSLTNLEPKSDAYKAFAKAEVLAVDESHLVAAKTLSEVNFGIAANAPYRFYLSATQTRGDGMELLLEGITGDIVHQFSAKEGIAQGYLAKPIFKVIKIKTGEPGKPKGAPNDITRKYLYYNKAVLDKAAEITNHCASKGQQVLILIKEIEHFYHLSNRIKFPMGFAHGPLAKGEDKFVAEQYRKTKPNDLVAAFDRKEFPILIGTSCISTGTDIKSVTTMIYLKGGKSEIEVKQGVGRTTRLFPGKTSCNVIDFDITDIDILHGHAQQRIEYYHEISGDVTIY